ncbi:DUF397 domain-containing protein [Streptomyces sp. NPDC048281]|uniref:DUF397 domain-containing protein n=1 Tax=Streptomyces sp. NPDC048281 TaxID=3154715 RepID=UPI003443B369
MRNIPDHELSWHKSSYSGGDENCLEVSDTHPTLIPVRDSKYPLGPKLVFRSAAWSAFVADVKGNAR